MCPAHPNLVSPAGWASQQHSRSHGLKLIDALFSVALTNLTQGLVFVTARPHILSVDQVIGGLFALIYSSSQFGAQELGKKKNTNTKWIKSSYLKVQDCSQALPLDSPSIASKKHSIVPSYKVYFCVALSMQHQFSSRLWDRGTDGICNLNKNKRMIMYRPTNV